MVARLSAHGREMAFSSGVRNPPDSGFARQVLRRRPYRRFRARQPRRHRAEPAAQLDQRARPRRARAVARRRAAVLARRGREDGGRVRRAAAGARPDRRSVARRAVSGRDRARRRAADARARERARLPARRGADGAVRPAGVVRRASHARRPRLPDRRAALHVVDDQPGARVPAAEPAGRATRGGRRRIRRHEREHVHALLPPAHGLDVRPVSEPAADQRSVRAADVLGAQRHRHLLPHRLQQPVELQPAIPRDEGDAAVALSRAASVERAA